MLPVIATAAGLVTGALLIGRANAGTRHRLASDGPIGAEAHAVADVQAPFGPYHKQRRPKGLPAVVAEATGPAGRVIVDGMAGSVARDAAARLYADRFGARPALVTVRAVRQASARGAALRPIADHAHRAGLGEAFVRLMTQLARTEGEGGTFAVPARNFNAPCQTAAVDRERRCTAVDAPRGGALITAWGVFQWNRDAGRDLATLDDLGLRAPRIPSDWMPWDWTAADEIGVPIDYYAQLYGLVRRRGRADQDAARAVRLWHTGPSRFRRFLADGADARAWGRADPAVARRIDDHLTQAGIA